MEQIEQNIKPKNENNIIKFEYSYNFSDIEDYLNWEYLEYLELLPNKLWIENKKKIEKMLLEQTDERIIKYLILKLNLKSTNIFKDLSKLKIKKFTFEYFKYITANYLDEFDKCLTRLYGFFEKIFSKILFCENNEYNDYAFNLFIGPKYSLHVRNYFEKYFNKCINTRLSLIRLVKTKSTSLNFDIFFRYINFLNYTDPYCKITFINHRDKDEFDYICDDLKKLRLFCSLIVLFNKITFEQLKELQKYSKVSNKLFKTKLIQDIKNYKTCFLTNICSYGDIDYFSKTINEYNIDLTFLNATFYSTTLINLRHGNFIAKLISCIAILKDIEKLSTFINLLKYGLNILINNSIYNIVVENIVSSNEYNFYEHRDIVCEFIKLGATPQKNSYYTEFAKSIKNNFLNE